ncbi:hypothetical protein [Roseovarius sp. SYSU LYC5161]|uniref:hypothetical protein n=1 Tax=Roseovarius halophilus (ex Wu et al. 2025) TaxID=3376060 RepID=UPI00287275EB|nr:hypothetical protein [Roseovarius sp.]
MPKYNATFELSLEDMELIENALHRKKQDLAQQLTEDAGGTPEVKPDDDMRQIHDLLGRLHNQKVFYRPRRGAYVGG